MDIIFFYVFLFILRKPNRIYLGRQINLYDLEGSLLISSKADIKQEVTEKCLEPNVLNALSNTAEHRFEERREEEDKAWRSSYLYITDAKFKDLAILNLPYLEKDDFLAKELDEFLERLAYTSLLVMLAAVALALARAAARMSAVDFGTAADAAEATAAGCTGAAAVGAGAALGATGAVSVCAALFAARILDKISLVEGVGSVIQPRQTSKKGKLEHRKL